MKKILAVLGILPLVISCNAFAPEFEAYLEANYFFGGKAIYIDSPFTIAIKTPKPLCITFYTNGKVIGSDEVQMPVLPLYTQAGFIPQSPEYSVGQELNFEFLECKTKRKMAQLKYTIQAKPK
jgi:hypothetical protein